LRAALLQNVAQDTQERFIVKLLIKKQILNKIGNFREIALKQFYSFERRFKRDPDLRIQYSQFMNEYLTLGHMQLLNKRADDDSEYFYIASSQRI